MNKSNEIISGTDKKNDANSCYSVSGNQKHGESSVNLSTVYQCPMKCEGDKTYKTPGSCSVCNMYLKQVK